MKVGYKNIVEISARNRHMRILLFPMALEIIWIPRSFWITFHIFDLSSIIKFRLDQNYFDL